MLIRAADAARQAVRRLLRWRTVGVRCIVTDPGRSEVLLVRHTYGSGYWYLPGGGVKRGESLRAAAEREVREETGERPVGALDLVGAFSDLAAGRNDHIILYEMVGTGRPGTRTSKLEIRDSRYFPLDALPEDVSPGSRRRIQEWRGESGAAERW